MTFVYRTAVQPDWIDYNGHMRDSNYGLVFSLAVDALQDELGFDAAYRERTGCTIYLLEDHKVYLHEVMEGDRLRIETRVLDCDTKRFHLHIQMRCGGTLAAAGELIELHVRQKPQPHAAEMPPEMLQRLQAAKISEEKRAGLLHRARAMGLARR